MRENQKMLHRIFAKVGKIGLQPFKIKGFEKSEK
jgi:hypothetical protein